MSSKREAELERKVELLQAQVVELGRTLDRTAAALTESQRALRKAQEAAAFERHRGSL